MIGYVERRIRASWTAVGPLLLGGCSTGSLPWLKSSVAELVQKPPVAAPLLVEAVVTLARGGFIDDPAKIEELLGLLGMAGALEWSSLSSNDSMSGSSASFWAGPGSSLRNVFLQRRVHNGTTYSNRLHVIFKKSDCPSRENVEAAFGAAFQMAMIPPLHGIGAWYPHYSLNLTASDGRNIRVTIDSDGCVIRLSTAVRS